jgi:hypothetical protein
MFIMCCFVINSIEITHLNVAYAFRVELPDGKAKSNRIGKSKIASRLSTMHPRDAFQ